MITKLLLTLAIVVAVIVWFRAQKSKQAQGRIIDVESIPEEAVKNTWIKPLLYSIGLLTLTLGVVMYYLSWQEDNTRYQVTISNPQTGSSDTYIALKKNMFGRMFITEGGLQINASELERIEIIKIEDD
jgi:Na+/proline symporter